MNHHDFAPSCWRTASLGHSADTSPGDLHALGEHLGSCQGLRGRLFALHCVAERTHGLLAPRFITTLVLAALVLAAAAVLS
jgi:hypothetical protein